MSLPRTATTRVVTDINRTAILDALRANGPLSRRDIQRKTGLSPATVERLCAALLSEKAIVPDGYQRSSGGRPSSLYRYAGDARVVAAVEVSSARVRGRLVDLDGKVVHESIVEFSGAVWPDGPGAASIRLDETIAMVGTLVASAARIRKPCVGVGVIVPGIVHGREGRITNAVELGWTDVSLGSILESSHRIPIVIENDANAIALGEWAKGAGVGAHSLASYVLGVGVGAGIVHDGAILRGYRSAAGEIGYLLTDRSGLGRLFTEQGDLESRIAAVARSYRPDQGASDPNPLAALLDDAADGQPLAVAAAGEIFDYIGLSCIALSTVLDPEVIVLGGHLTRQPAFAVDQVSRRLVGRITFPPRVTVSKLGVDAALVGVSQLTITRVRDATYLA